MEFQARLANALLDQFTAEDLEELLKQKRKVSNQSVSKPKPMNKWQLWELHCETELKKILKKT